MNKIYKVIWSKTRNCYVAVSEIARNHGKDSVRSEKRGMFKGTFALALCIALSLGVTGSVWAAPELPRADTENNDYLIFGENVFVRGLYEGDGGNLNVAGKTTTGSLELANGAIVLGADGSITASSISVGRETDATGSHASSFGERTYAYGNDSFAAGQGYLYYSGGNKYQTDTIAYGTASIAMGYGVQAKGTGSSAFGGLTKAGFSERNAESSTSNYAAAFGYKTTAAGEGAVAFGLGGQYYYYDNNRNYILLKNTGAYGKYSATFGDRTDATGNNATAFGYQTRAESDNSVVFGEGSKTIKDDGMRAIAPGYYSQDSQDHQKGANAVAFGYYATAQGTSSLAFGSQTYSKGTNSTAFGIRTTAEGNRSTAFGGDTWAIGNKSTSFGTFTAAHSENSTSFGDRTQASGKNSLAFGHYTTTGVRYQSEQDKKDGVYSMKTVDGDAFKVNKIEDKQFAMVLTDDQGNAVKDINGNLVYHAHSTNNWSDLLAVRYRKTDENGTPVGDYIIETVELKNGKYVPTGYQPEGITLNDIDSLTQHTEGSEFRYGPGPGQYVMDETAPEAKNAVAFGNDTNAQAANSLAFGDATIAAEKRATAFGNHTQATGDSATAFGDNALASARNATAFGESSRATQKNATAYGQENAAIGTSATAWGHKAKAFGEASTAYGDKSLAAGKYAASFGEATISVAQDSVSWGSKAVAGISTKDNDYKEYVDMISGIHQDDSKKSLVELEDELKTARKEGNIAQTAALTNEIARHEEKITDYYNRHFLDDKKVVDKLNQPLVDQLNEPVAERVNQANLDTILQIWVDERNKYLAQRLGKKVDELTEADGKYTIENFPYKPTLYDLANYDYPINTATTLDDAKVAEQLNKQPINKAVDEVVNNWEQEYADAHGKSVEQLTWSERNQVLEDKVNEWNQQIATELGKTVETLTEKEKKTVEDLYVRETENARNKLSAEGKLYTDETIPEEFKKKTVEDITDDMNPVKVTDKKIGRNATAWGNGTNAFGSAATAWGKQTVAEGDNATAWGNKTVAVGTNSTAFGNQSIAVGVDSTALGKSSKAWGDNSLAALGGTTGKGTVTKDSDTGEITAIVRADNGNAEDAIAIGKGATAEKSHNVAIGQKAKASGADSIAIGAMNAEGTGSTAKGANSIAIGTANTVEGTNSIAIGTGHTVKGNNSGAFGDPDIVNGDNSYIVGNNSKIDTGTNDAFILGNNASVTASGGVAIGTGSKASRDAENESKGSASTIYGYDMSNGSAHTPVAADPENNIAGDVNGTWAPTAASVAVGAIDKDHPENNITRRITGVAAGSEDTDAVNVAQLMSATSGSAIHYYSVNDTGSVREAGNGTNYNNDGATGINSMAAGQNTLANGNNGVVVGHNSMTSGNNSTIIGQGSSAAGGVETRQYTRHHRDRSVYGPEVDEYTDRIPSGWSDRYEYSSDNNSILGQDTHIVGNHNIAIGTGSNVGGTHDTGSTSQWHSGSVYGNDWGYWYYDYERQNGATNSTLIGDNSNLTGDYSTIVGSNSSIISFDTYYNRPENAEKSSIVGYNSHITGDHSIIVGSDSTISNYSKYWHYDSGTSTYDYGDNPSYDSIIVGDSSNILGSSSIIFGTNSSIKGYAKEDNTEIGAHDSVAFGNYAKIRGDQNVAIGGYSYIGDYYISSNDSHAWSTDTGSVSNSTAIGNSSTVYSDNGTAVGQGAMVVGANSSAFGQGATIYGKENNTAIGARSSTGIIWSKKWDPETHSYVHDGYFGANNTAVGADSHTGSGYNNVAIGTGTMAGYWSNYSAEDRQKALENAVLDQYGGSEGAMAEAFNRAGKVIDAQIANNPPDGYAEWTDEQKNDYRNSEISRYLYNSSSGQQIFKDMEFEQWQQGKIQSDDYSTAVGVEAQAAGAGQTAVGGRAKALGWHSTAVGLASKAEGASAIAIGESANTNDNQEIAVGNYAHTYGQSSIAMGRLAGGNTNYAIAIGDNATVQYRAEEQWIVEGYNEDGSAKLADEQTNHAQRLVADQSIAIGRDSYVDGKDATAVGRNTQARMRNATAYGNNAHANAWNSIAIGNKATAGLQIEILNDDGTVKDAEIANSAIAIGNRARATSEYTTAIGAGTNAEGWHAVAVGDSNQATGKFSTAVGSGWSINHTEGEDDLDNTDDDATGDGVNTEGLRTYESIGANVAAGDYSTSVGYGNTTVSEQSLAVGAGNVIGDISGERDESGVIIGGDEKADGSIAFGNWNTVTGKQSIAVGNGHVVAGDYSGAFGDPSYINDDNAYAIGNNNRIEGGSANSFVVGNNVTTTKENTVVVGQHTENNTHTFGANSVSLGTDADSVLEDSVALGSYAKADTVDGYETAGENDVVVGSLKYSSSRFAGTGENVIGTVSVGDAGKERTITNVAAGRILAESTDAINGSQLYAAYDQLQWKVGIDKDGGTNDDGALHQSVVGKPDANTDKSNVQFIAGKGIDISASNMQNTETQNGYGIKISSKFESATTEGDNITEITYDGKTYIIGGGDSIATDNRVVGLKENKEGKQEIISPFVNIDGVEEATAKGHESGLYAYAQGKNSIAIGSEAKARKENSIALGVDAEAFGEQSVAIGQGAKAGDKSDATKGKGAVAIGGQSVSTGEFSVAMQGGKATGNYAMAFGENAEAKGDHAMAFGSGTIANGNKAMAFGSGTTANGNQATAFGTGTVAEGENATAFGMNSAASGADSTAFGNNSHASADNSMAAIGGTTVKGATNAAAVGEGSVAQAENSLAMSGGKTSKDAKNSAAIGEDAEVVVTDAVALGSRSVASTEAGIEGYDILLNAASTDGSPVWKANENAIAVGNGAQNTRQITGVAAGMADTDAVNVAQLKRARVEVLAGSNVTVDRNISNGYSQYTVNVPSMFSVYTGGSNKSGYTAGSSVGSTDKLNVSFDFGDGLKASEISEGYWHVGLDEEYIKNDPNLKGEKGDPGKNGENGTSVSITKLEKSETDTKITFSDGNEIEIKNGTNGKDGVNGKDGTSVTITKTESNDDGTKVTFSDGNVIDIKNGKDGVDGKNGVDGKDGTSVTITKTETTETGTTVTFSDGKEISIANGKDGADGKDGLNGADGKDGKDGRDGRDGKDGINGIDGRDGRDGKDGADGKDGKDGINGLNGLDGRDGRDGKDGVDGKDGKDGIDGKDGTSVTITKTETTETGATVTFSDGKEISIANGKDGADGKDGLNGADGKDGRDGRDGKDGLNGADGKDGKDGLNGADGRDGRDGKDGLNGVDGKDGKDGKDGINGTDGKDGRDGRDGAPGEKGDKGDKGDTGEKGDKGDKGDIGEKGDKGDKGDTGEKGDKGDKGDTGAAGKDGSADPAEIQRIDNNVNAVNNRVDRLENHMKKGLAGAAALAALHPLDFDPDDKLEFSAGVGHYRGETAAAIGAFYHPNDDTIFSLGATVGNGDNMINGGITWRFGQHSNQSRSKKAMAKEIIELREEVAELKAMVYNLTGNNGLDPSKTAVFPDTPENHWAYDYVAVLAGNGVLEGYQDGYFRGNRQLTRYEMAAIIYRLMSKGIEVDSRMLQEFAPELARVKVDTLTHYGDGTPHIQRVRIIPQRG